jgi:hypothetical protein
MIGMIYKGIEPDDIALADELLDDELLRFDGINDGLCVLDGF